MTKVKLHAPVAEMHGEFEKNSGIIMRQKKYRAPNGAVQNCSSARFRQNTRTRRRTCQYALFRGSQPDDNRNHPFRALHRRRTRHNDTRRTRAYNRTPPPVGELSYPFLCPVQEPRSGSTFREKTASRRIQTLPEAVFQARHIHPSPPSPKNSNKQLKIPQTLAHVGFFMYLCSPNKQV